MELSDALAAKVGAEKEPAALIAMAKDMGFELTEDDFKQQVEELGDDELDAVAGYSKNGRERCVCSFAGYGYDT